MIILKFTSGYFDDQYLNTSVEVNDLIYYVPNTFTPAALDYGTQVDTGTTQSNTNMVFIGYVSAILTDTPLSVGNVNGVKIIVEQTFDMIEGGVQEPSQNDFIFFVKNNKHLNVGTKELSTLKGYYGSITLENDSTKKAELFSVSAEVTESSK